MFAPLVDGSSWCQQAGVAGSAGLTEVMSVVSVHVFGTSPTYPKLLCDFIILSFSFLISTFTLMWVWYSTSVAETFDLLLLTFSINNNKRQHFGM